jgi:O-antigen ligase
MSPGAGQGGIGTKLGRWNGFVVLFVFALVPLLGYLAPLGFAPLVALGGLMTLPLLPRERRLELWPVVVLGLLLGWMALSTLWSPHQPKDLTSSIAFKLTLLVMLGLSLISALAVMPREAARRGAVLLAAGMAGLSLILIADALAGARIYQALKLVIDEPIRPDLARRNIAQGAYVLALMFWPAAQAVGRLGWRMAAFPVALMVAAVLAANRMLDADAPLFALAAGGVVWLAVRWLGPVAVRILLAAGVAAFTLAPLLMLEGVRTGLIGLLRNGFAASWNARLDIWTYVASQASVHPLRGWGVDASRSFGELIPLHPHNAALQIWLELGAPGAALAGALIGWIAACIAIMARTNPSHAAAAAAAMTAYLVIGALSFGVWQEWWVALGLLTVAALAVLRRAWPRG